MSDRDDLIEPSLLERQWLLHVADDGRLLRPLLARHREKHRRYHTTGHTEAVVESVLELVESEVVDDLGAVVAAALYHDAVYEPQSPANERASARLARRDLATLGWRAERIDHVASMIEATRDHTDPPDLDHAVLFDADLAILGVSAEAYATYVERVRAEYRHVDDEAWRTGRSTVLGSFLERAGIYATVTGRTRWEDAARRNLTAELRSLDGATTG